MILWWLKQCLTNTSLPAADQKKCQTAQSKSLQYVHQKNYIHQKNWTLFKFYNYAAESAGRSPNSVFWREEGKWENVVKLFPRNVSVTIKLGRIYQPGFFQISPCLKSKTWISFLSLRSCRLDGNPIQKQFWGRSRMFVFFFIYFHVFLVFWMETRIFRERCTKKGKKS